ncbi:hypothetical protein, partial [Cysteiniphilum litorale]|uniref:hypothetical protein n=1 Tax=Cysteiniphilum litorale TaxID=2056700 RepID=UPI003F884CB6
MPKFNDAFFTKDETKKKFKPKKYRAWTEEEYQNLATSNESQIDVKLESNESQTDVKLESNESQIDVKLESNESQTDVKLESNE